MTDKTFHLQPDQIENLIDNRDGCLATDRIVVDGEPVGYMYREANDHELDSGWRFMAGDESPQYMGDADNIGIYALNTLANYDQDIIPHLGSPAGAYFAREEPGGPFVRLLDEGAAPVPEGLHPDFPVVEGEYRVTANWMLTLPVQLNRRIEDDSMVLWRPGLTAHIVAWDNTPGDAIADRAAQLLDSVSPAATGLTRVEQDDIVRVRYRLTENGVDTIATFVVNETSQLLAQIHFDDDASGEHALAIADSLRLYEDPT